MTLADSGGVHRLFNFFPFNCDPTENRTFTLAMADNDASSPGGNEQQADPVSFERWVTGFRESAEERGFWDLYMGTGRPLVEPPDPEEFIYCPHHLRTLESDALVDVPAQKVLLKSAMREYEQDQILANEAKLFLVQRADPMLRHRIPHEAGPKEAYDFVVREHDSIFFRQRANRITARRLVRVPFNAEKGANGLVDELQRVSQDAVRRGFDPFSDDLIIKVVLRRLPQDRYRNLIELIQMIRDRDIKVEGLKRLKLPQFRKYLDTFEANFLQ